MRFLHLGLVVSLVLTTKASDPNPDDRVSENPTGRAAVHGHPKVVAGSGDYRHAPPPFPYNSKHNTEPHYHDTYEDSNDVSDYYKDDYHRGVEEANIHKPHTEMTEDDAMMQSQELANAVEPNEAMTEEMSEHDEMISLLEANEVVHEIVDKLLRELEKFDKSRNFIAHVEEATGTGPFPLRSGQVGPVIVSPFDLLKNSEHSLNRDVSDCQCSTITDWKGRGNCRNGKPLDNGRHFCYLERCSGCPDEQPSFQLRGYFWSHQACLVGDLVAFPEHPL